MAKDSHDASLQDALELLERASTTPAKQRSVKISGVVDIICGRAFAHGLEEDALRTVVQITSRKSDLDQTTVTTLIKNLYPAQEIPSDVIVAVISALGQGKGKPSPGSQNAFVKWLALVHDIIADASTLSRLYGVLFGMLDMISIRTPLCHLLSLITRRKHVKPFRIQQVLELSRGLGNEPALQGLLRVYKDYYPDIILGSTALTRSSFPPLRDAEWQARIMAIKEQKSVRATSAADKHNGFKVLRHGPGSSRSSAVPNVHTFHANESSVTLEGIDSVDDFIEKLDRIELPGQLISFLTDPLLQKYVELNPSMLIRTRIDLWLSACLEEQCNAVKQNSIDVTFLHDLLDALAAHARSTKTLLHIVEAFLKEFLAIWDGQLNVDAVLDLLTYIETQPFQAAYFAFIQPAEHAIIRHGLDGYVSLINFYTSLLHQWCIKATSQPSSAAPALSQPDQISLSNLTSHVTHLCTSILLSTPARLRPQLTSPILSFLEVVASASSPHKIPILLPTLPLFYLLASEPSLSTFSRICGIVGAYKNAFNSHPPPIREYYAQHTVDAINCVIRDLYHLLWLSRALSHSVDEATGVTKAAGLLCAPELREQLHAYLSGTVDASYAVHAAFGPSFSPLLSSTAAAAWREMEEHEVLDRNLDRDSVAWHNGPVRQRSLEVLKKEGGVDVSWDGYRAGVLKWLGERGLDGGRVFLWASSENVRKRWG